MEESIQVQKLISTGDPLEKEIAKHADKLHPVLQPYCEVWEKHIVPRRIESGSRVPDEWMNFAGSHYTALIRVHHAKQSLDELLQLVEHGPGQSELGVFLLEIHKTCASFWEHIGSVIDNLGQAFEDAKLIGTKTKGRDYLTGKYEDLDYAYDRRSQFIHSRVVPTTTFEGAAFFRINKSETYHRHLEPKNSHWDVEYDGEIFLVDTFPKEWERFLKAVSRAWWHLRERVDQVDMDRLTNNDENARSKPSSRLSSGGTGKANIDDAESRQVPPLPGFDGPPPSGT